MGKTEPSDLESPHSSGDRLLNSFEGETFDGESITVWKETRPWCNFFNLAICWIAGIIIIVLASVLVIQSVKLSKHHPATVTGFSAGQSGRCGTNSTEAISLGCVFDYMNFSWQPPECYDAELDKKHSDRMRKGGPVKWWADANLTRPIPDDPNVLMMYTEVWVERRFHYKHCMYGWENLHLSYQDGRPMPDLMTYHHSLHCAMVLDRAIREDNGTELLIEHAVTWYSACIYPEV